MTSNLSGETYLVLKKGTQGFQKLLIKEARTRMPALESDEIAVKISIIIPDSYFDQHIPRVQIDVPEAAVIKPDVQVEMPNDE